MAAGPQNVDNKNDGNADGSDSNGWLRLIFSKQRQ